MLQNIRDNTQGIIAKVVIALIIVPFALFGVDSLFNTSGPKAVAEVNGTDISEAELSQAIALQKRRLIGMMGDKVDPSILDDTMLRKPALNSLVKQALLLQAADQAQVVVSKPQLNATIAAMPQFEEDGRFSQTRYEQILRLQGYSSSMFKDLLRSDLVIQQLSNGVAGSAFVTEAQMARLVEVLHETRTFNFITVPSADFADQVAVSDEEIQVYFEASPQQFQSEEKVRLSYLELNLSQFLKPVDEEQIQAEYQRLVASMEQDSQRHAAHILIEINNTRSREAAAAALNEVKQKLAAGSDFAELAKNYSEDAGSSQQGGDLGYSSGDSFPPEFEEALASLSAGQVSDVVETDAGLHLIKLLDISEPVVPAYEEQRDEIAKRLQEQRARPALIAAVEDLRDLVFNAEDLSMPAKEMALNVQQTDWLTRNSDSPLFAADNLRKAAFDAKLRKDNLNSEVFELSPERFAVIHVQDYAAPSTLPLASVRDKIIKQLSADKAREMARAKADSLAEELKEGADVQTLAEANKLQWQNISEGKRSAAGVKPAIRNKAFSLPVAEAGSSVDVVAEPGQFVVVQLTQVTPGDIAQLDSATLNATRKSLYAQQMGQDFSSYFNNLWDNADIVIR